MADATKTPRPRKRPVGPAGEGGFFDVESACRYLGVSRTRFWQWRNDGHVPNKGRWTREELDAVTIPRRRRTKAQREADSEEHAAPATAAAAPSAMNEVQGDPWKLNLPAEKVAQKDPPAGETAGAAGAAAATPKATAPAVTNPPAPAVAAAAPKAADGFWGAW